MSTERDTKSGVGRAGISSGFGPLASARHDTPLRAFSVLFESLWFVPSSVQPEAARSHLTHVYTNAGGMFRHTTGEIVTLLNKRRTVLRNPQAPGSVSPMW